MKFPVIAALLGLSQAVKITEEMKLKGQILEANRMHELCKMVNGIEFPSELVQLDEATLPIADKRSSGTDTTADTAPADKTADQSVDKLADQPPANPVKKNIEGTYKQHYGKTKEEVDAENQHILQTQKTCLDFVKKYQGHPKVCDWCKNEYKRPQVVWKWDPEEETWYRYYDGGWHYWGPSKDGFTEGGWKWYNGHWHNDGYTFKYEDGKWYRFQDKEWVIYGDEVPVNPEPPTGKKICRPFYKMMKQGFPVSLASTEVPRCKVGDQIYMWTDEAACRFLGGVKAMQERVQCKSGEQHKWKRVVKCAMGPQQLPNGGLDYKTGQLKSNLYKFKQCGLYRASGGNGAQYLYLFGEMHWVPNYGPKVFVQGRKITDVSSAQLASVKKGKQLMPNFRVVHAQGGAYFLDNYELQQFESEKVFDACQFDRNLVTEMSDKEFAKKQIGDIITIPI